VKDGASQFQNLFCEFPLTILYQIITVRLDCQTFYARWVPKILTGVHKTQGVALAFSFLEQYQNSGNEFLNHFILVTSDKTWVSFVNAETKQEGKQWRCTDSPIKLEKFKQTSV
jgi:hypothetical protein